MEIIRITHRNDLCYVATEKGIFLCRTSNDEIVSGIVLDPVLYLVRNDLQGSLAANSIFLAYIPWDGEFKTTTLADPSDIVSNCMTFDPVGGADIDFANPSAKVINCLPNTDPEFADPFVPPNWFLYDTLTIMSNSFIPKISSPVLNAGENSYVADIETDIIGNPRRYLFSDVDIGPYELQVHQLLFTAEQIQSIFQDKLHVDTSNSRFVPVTGDDIYTDLWTQFDDNPNYREEFVRESKVIIKLKTLATDIKSSTDKKNIELARFEAYFDLKTRSIVLSKTDENLGAMLSTIFDDGRYKFYFDEVEHILIVYINPTYNMGKSGKGNIVNEVRAGGSAIINR